MRKAYYTINDVLRSPWVKYKPDAQKSTSTDRVLRSTKLEDSIYADLRNDDPELERIEQGVSAKMASFPALTRDVFQSFYSLMPRQQETGLLSAAAQRFNVPILDHVLAHEDYPTIKAICEGRELPAYEAAAEFTAKTSGELDDLLSSLGGDKKSVNPPEKLEAAQTQAESELSGYAGAHGKEWSA